MFHCVIILQLRWFINFAIIKYMFSICSKKVYISTILVNIMGIRSSENSVGAWAFLIGVIFAVIIGIGTSSFLNLDEIRNYNAQIFGVLVLLGIIVGFTIKISGKNSETFLIAGAVIVIVSRFGMDVVSGTIIGVSIGDTVASTFGALLTLFVPATIIVALKRVFSIANI